MDEQALFFLSDKATFGEEAERIIRTYSYATVVAVWPGRYEGREGTYFVAEGPEHVLQATAERMASGLHFVNKVQSLA